MLLEPTRLASYISSKICHDLVSPVGAAASAIDFMNDPSAGDMRAQAEELLASGTMRALARLQFLRYAFGSMGISNGSAELHEAKSIIEGYVDTHKGKVEWDIQAEGLTFAQIRILMNLVMLGLSCLSREGKLLIEIRQRNKIEIKLIASGPRAKFAADVRVALERSEPEDGWNPRTIQPYFTTVIVDEVGGKLSTEVGDERVAFTVSGL